MTCAHDIFIEARSLGLTLEPHGSTLLVYPKGATPPWFGDKLRENKSIILEFLSKGAAPGWQSVPPDDLALIDKEPAPSPEQRALLIDYLVRQGCDRPNALTRWLAARENVYYSTCATAWDCAVISYASARDCACWQLNRSEVDVLAMLENLDSMKGLQK